MLKLVIGPPSCICKVITHVTCLQILYVVACGLGCKITNMWCISSSKLLQNSSIGKFQFSVVSIIFPNRKKKKLHICFLTFSVQILNYICSTCRLILLYHSWDLWPSLSLIKDKLPNCWDLATEKGQVTKTRKLLKNNCMHFGPVCLLIHQLVTFF